MPVMLDFVTKWEATIARERAHKDQFLLDLCDFLGVPRPEPTTRQTVSPYAFEHPVRFPLEDGKVTPGFIDLYKEGCFVLEAKQGQNDDGDLAPPRRGSPAWHVAMQKAYGQAIGYAKTFDDPPPFVVVCDVGYCLDLYAQFDGTGLYRPFPTAQQSRVFLKDLASRPELVERLRLVFTDPHALDPAKRSTRITREVAAKLAELSKTLEAGGQHPEQVAKFLMRCIFTMFAEDVGLLPKALFHERIEKEWLKHPDRFQREIRELWDAMDRGGPFGFGDRLLQFNGGLFKGSFALPLTKAQLAQLLDCAKCDWAQVEPSIFGTLLERALSPQERHRLGAHYTPRAYVERLVRPTLEEPLRQEWDAVRVRAHQAQQSGKAKDLAKARKAVVEFHTKLCHTRVLDPACGTGNFLYVAFDLFKRLEGEVLQLERDLTQEGEALRLDLQIRPEQFLGLEVKPWAKQIAELVLWIGYLQWHFRTRGTARPEEPVLRNTDNIQCRDAVLDWDDKVEALDDDGKPLTRWDGVTFKKHPVTGLDVPDESARTPVWKYVNPRPALWPEAEFIIGNPPFLGTKRMRAALGDGYVDAVRAVYAHQVEDNADFVMLWWNKAARRLTAPRTGLIRFGFITTNSITQNFNRRVVESCLKGGARLLFAIPDHPWVDNEDGAAVRVAMTVGGRFGNVRPAIDTVASETESPSADGSRNVTVVQKPVTQINADLGSGSRVARSAPLQANAGISGMGVALHGHGFVLEASELTKAARQELGRTVRPYVGGRDLLQTRRERYVIDFSFMSEDQARKANPAAFQRVIERVKPERDLNRRDSIRKLWWRFGWERPVVRDALKGLNRFIATTETAKHRVFQFLESDLLPDHMVVLVASSDSALLGVLSSRAHVAWALRAGGTLEDRPRYNKRVCFDPFPFPACTDAQKQRIRARCEDLDAHRKRQQALHPDLTITGMYNVLEKLRSFNSPSAPHSVLTPKEKAIHEQGLVSVLKDLHDRLDAAVFDAYGWPATLTDEEIIERLVALNAERAAEEKRGLVRWLRPEFQNPAGQVKPTQVEADIDADDDEEKTPATAAASGWPKALPDRMSAVRDAVMGTQSVTGAWLAKQLGAKKPAEVVEVLEGLTVLGHLVAAGKGDARTWRTAGKRAT